MKEHIFVPLKNKFEPLSVAELNHVLTFELNYMY